jgi:hypothetical protein
MKIQKILFLYLPIGAVIMSFLLCASAAQSQEVILDPDSDLKRATGITNLSVEGNLYNVTFTSYVTALEMYGEVEGTFLFPATLNSAQNTITAVNAALDAEGDVLFVGSEGGTNDEFAEYYYVGFKYHFVSVGKLEGIDVWAGFYDEAVEVDWKISPEPNLLSWYFDEKTYIELTPISGCVPATTCTEGSVCGTEPDGCGATIDCGDCVAEEICSDDNVCVEAPPAECVDDSDCTEGVCVDSICVEAPPAECVDDSDCTEGVCVDSICVEDNSTECEDDSDCGENFCVENLCVECVNDDWCDEGDICKDALCVSDCPEDIALWDKDNNCLLNKRELKAYKTTLKINQKKEQRDLKKKQRREKLKYNEIRKSEYAE